MKARIVFLLTSVIANASTILLDTTGGATPSSLGFTNGTVGQGIIVNTSTTLTQFGIWVGNKSGGDAEFQVWDSTFSNMLFSDVETVNPGSFSLVLTATFSLQLQAGHTYYFDVLGPSGGPLDPADAQELGYTLSPVSSSDGLSLVFPDSRVNSVSAAVGSPQDNLPIAIELIGDQSSPGPTATSPEPSTLALFALSGALLIITRRSFGR